MPRASRRIGPSPRSPNCVGLRRIDAIARRSRGRPRSTRHVAGARAIVGTSPPTHARRHARRRDARRTSRRRAVMLSAIVPWAQLAGSRCQIMSRCQLSPSGLRDELQRRSPLPRSALHAPRRALERDLKDLEAHLGDSADPFAVDRASCRPARVRPPSALEASSAGRSHP